MFSFIHTADLHLGTPFKSHFKDERMKEKLEKSTYSAFDILIDLCIDEGIDFLIIAGDVFDSTRDYLSPQLKLRDGLNRLDEMGIKTFITCGNHDPKEYWLTDDEWQSNVHVFSAKEAEAEEIITKSGEKVIIHGISYKKRDVSDNLAKKFKRSVENDAFEIGVLHCNVGSQSGHEDYSPCTKDDLKRVGLNYWALGHIHNRDILDQDPYIIYPGNIQGRHINETGEKRVHR